MSSIDIRLLSEIQRNIAQSTARAQHVLAVQAQRDTEPYVPALTLSLSNRTQVIDNTIVYPGPYARYLYHGKVMVDAATGKGPMKIVGENGVELIRFRKGATLKPTDRDLNIQRTVHPYAQSYWFEASKANNKDKWLRVYRRALLNGL